MITKVSDYIFRGPAPKTAADWYDLKDLGIKIKLDLQTGVEAMNDGSPLSAELAGEMFGIKTYGHPLSEFLPPSKRDLEEAYALIKMYATQQAPIYIHCKHGQDRTGMVIAYLRMKCGWTKAAAVKEALSLGMKPWYFYWRWTL